MTNPNITFTDTMWIQAISFATTGIALPLGGYLEKIWGPRNTTLIAALLMRFVNEFWKVFIQFRCIR